MKTTIIIILFVSSLFAQQQTLNKFRLKQVTENQLTLNQAFIPKIYSDKISLHSWFLEQSSRDNFRDTLPNMIPVKSKEKSPILGGLFSALLPGAGEFYAQSYLKAAIFLGVEIASWTFFAIYQGKGNKQTDSFEGYANQYWSVRKYAQWLVDNGFRGVNGINPNEPDLNVLRNQIINCESQNFSHTLPEYNSQQYYELIGKYQNFQGGWTNLQHEPVKDPTSPYYYETYHDPIFTYYAGERQKANDFYNMAKNGVFVVIFNHILSAADAIWCVSVFNKNLRVQTGMKIREEISPYTFRSNLVPTVNMNIQF